MRMRKRKSGMSKRSRPQIGRWCVFKAHHRRFPFYLFVTRLFLFIDEFHLKELDLKTLSAVPISDRTWAVCNSTSVCGWEFRFYGLIFRRSKAPPWNGSYGEKNMTDIFTSWTKSKIVLPAVEFERRAFGLRSDH